MSQSSCGGKMSLVARAARSSWLALIVGGSVVGCVADASGPAEPPPTIHVAEPPPDPATPDPIPTHPIRDGLGHPIDFSSGRVVSAPRDDGSTPAPSNAVLDVPIGDWNYKVNGPVDGGVAVWSTSGFGKGLRKCNDMLFVPVDVASGANVVAFDNLFKTDSSGTACVESTPVSPTGTCTPSPKPDKHCPHLSWSASLTGALKRDSISISLDGTKLYAATTKGKFYALNSAPTLPTGTTRIAWTFDAAADTGAADATFEGVAPWVDYFTGKLYVAVSYASDTKMRVYKLTDGTSATKVWATDINAGTRSTPILYNGFLYIGGLDGKVYKLNDSTGAQVTTKWPVQLKSASGAALSGTIPIPDVASQILSSPTIDGGIDTMFVTLGNVTWSIHLGGANDAATDYVEMGWQTATEAAANNVLHYSSPFIFIDKTTRVLFTAHGKDQTDGQTNRLHRRLYNADGTFVKTGLTSAVVRGSFSAMSDPKSSPIVFRPTSTDPIYAFVGDSLGYLNRFVYDESTQSYGTSSTFPTSSPSTVGAIESPVIVDIVGGNLYFGANDSRVYQIGQASLQ